MAITQINEYSFGHFHTTNRNFKNYFVKLTIKIENSNNICILELIHTSYNSDLYIFGHISNANADFPFVWTSKKEGIKVIDMLSIRLPLGNSYITLYYNIVW